jgi:hypothetical protein
MPKFVDPANVNVEVTAYKTTIPETTKIGTSFLKAKATDKDANVRHSLSPPPNLGGTYACTRISK